MQGTIQALVVVHKQKIYFGDIFTVFSGKLNWFFSYFLMGKKKVFRLRIWNKRKMKHIFRVDVVKKHIFLSCFFFLTSLDWFQTILFWLGRKYLNSLSYIPADSTVSPAFLTQNLVSFELLIYFSIKFLKNIRN